jgi:hypothetical protein
MHSGLGEIPDGWAICDGTTHTYNGVESTTPDLRNRFIKAASSKDDTLTAFDNPDLNSSNEFKLTKEHLPSHSHPHDDHTHTLSGTLTTGKSGNLSLSMTNDTNVKSVSTGSSTVVTGVTTEGISTSTGSVISSVSPSTHSTSVSGGDHDHSVNLGNGTVSSTTSLETSQTWENNSFKIEPNYYSLIFIMKL